VKGYEYYLGKEKPISFGGFMEINIRDLIFKSFRK
jgi:hypothetical protein